MSIFDFEDIEEDPPEEPEKISKDIIPSNLVSEGTEHALTRAAKSAGMDISREDAAELMTFMQRSKFGHQASLSMVCKGEKCDFIKICPLKKIGAALPIDSQCPVEDALVEQWVTMYMENLGIDQEDPANAIEVHMVYELAGLELIRRRAAHELSKSPSLVKNDIVGYSPQGQPIYDDKPSQALLILERHSKIVNKLRDSLLATPKSAAQAGQVNSDLSTRTANVIQKSKAIAEARRSGKSISDVDFQVIDDNEKTSQDNADKEKQD